MDRELLNSLWNVIQELIWDKLDSAFSIAMSPSRYNILVTSLWRDFLKLRVHDLDRSWSAVHKDILNWFCTKAYWYEIYDMLEFLAQNLLASESKRFVVACNGVLQREMSAYRFIGKQICPITDDNEIATLDEALDVPVKGTAVHLSNALAKLSDRKDPDYRNSIKESICAVESIAKIISSKPKATLGEALDNIERQGVVKLHPGLKEGYKKIYGYTSDKDGIRHSMLEKPSLDFEDAYYMLISCSAFINYLVAKAQKAGIELNK